MCLHIKSSFVAEKPIFAYKVGKRHGEFILTYFQDSLLLFNKLNIDSEFNEKRHENLLSSLNEYPPVEIYTGRGYFHAFVSSARAIDFINNSHCDYYSYNYFLTIIPKGSVGFYGLNNEICSNQMIFLHSRVPNFKEICSQYGITDDEYHKLLNS